jgi:flagellar biosynthesis protein FlhG
LAKTLPDQAEGLRRLLNEQLRVVTLMSGNSGAGKTSAAVNLAAALAATGRDVLLIDENGAGQRTSGNVAAALDLDVRFDLLHLLNGERTLEGVLLEGPGGVQVLPSARGAQALTGDAQAGHALAQCFRGMATPFDYVVIDSAPESSSNLLALDAGNQDIVIVLSSAASSITEAYALVKLLNQRHAHSHFHVLVNRAASEQEALTIFQNMAQVARGYLAVTLDFIGFIPADAKLSKARQLRRAVVEAYPAAPAAVGFRALAEAITAWPVPRANGADLAHFFECLQRGSRSCGDRLAAQSEFRSSFSESYNEA